MSTVHILKNTDLRMYKGYYNLVIIRTIITPWPGASVVWNIILYTKRLGVRFLVRAHV